MSKIYLIILATLLPAICFAQDTYSKMGFYVSAALKGGPGTGGNKSESIESRDFYHYGAEATLGLRFGAFLLGGSAEYNIWDQKTKPLEVGNTNLAGKQINLGPVAGVGLGPFMLAFKPILSSSMTLSKKNSAGDKVEFSSPDFPAYSAQLNYRLGVSSFVGIDYSSVTYKKMKSGGTSSTLASDDKVTYSGWSIVYGLMF